MTVPSEIIYTPSAADTLRLVEIDRDNYVAVLRLGLPQAQRRFVASNAFSIVQGHYHPEAWFRAVYLNEEPVGFVMLYDPRKDAAIDSGQEGAFDPTGKVRDDGLFIWRLMIDHQQQGRGIGRRLIALLANLAQANGFMRLYLSYVDAPEGPGPFYARCGFVKTGRLIDGEIEAMLELGRD